MIEPAIANVPKKEDEMIDLVTERMTQRQAFMRKLNQEQVKYVREHKPFCFRCAKIDFEDEQNRTWNRWGSNKKSNMLENVPVSLNLDDYGDLKRFKLIAETPIFQKKLLDGMRAEVETGVYKEMKCKERGCGLSVEVPHETKKKQ